MDDTPEEEGEKELTKEEAAAKAQKAVSSFHSSVRKGATERAVEGCKTLSPREGAACFTAGFQFGVQFSHGIWRLGVKHGSRLWLKCGCGARM